MHNKACLIVVMAIVVAVLFSFVAPSGASIRDGGAGLDEAVNPFGGTREQWNALVEDGGVQKHDRWNGLPVSNARVHFDPAGKVVEILLSTNQTMATVREIRDPINRICGFKEKDWDMTTSGNFLSGTAENARCSAKYLPEDEKYWTYSIRRLAKAAK